MCGRPRWCLAEEAEDAEGAHQPEHRDARQAAQDQARHRDCRQTPPPPRPTPPPFDHHLCSWAAARRTTPDGFTPPPGSRGDRRLKGQPQSLGRRVLGGSRRLATNRRGDRTGHDDEVEDVPAVGEEGAEPVGEHVERQLHRENLVRSEEEPQLR